MNRAIVAALEARAASRPTLEVDLSEILSDVTGKVRMRVLTVGEEAEAEEAAYTWRKNVLSALPAEHAKSFLDDTSFLEDAVAIECMARACRDFDDTSKPALSSAEVRKHLTPHECAALCERFGAAKAKLSGKSSEYLNQEQREALASACAISAGSDMPDRAIAKFPRSVLADLFVWASCEMSAKDEEIARLRAVVSANEAKASE